MDPQTPPLGYKPGQTRAPLIWNIALPLGVAAVTLACLRLYVRICLVRIFGKDDWLLLAAVIFLCGIVGSALWGTSLGIGKHQYDVNREIDTRKFIAGSIMTNLFYNLCVCCVQCSILTFYLRLGLAEIGKRYMRRMIYALMGICVALSTISPCLQLAFTHVRSLFTQSKYYTILWFTNSILNFLVDLTIWSIPLPTIFSVMHNLSTQKRILLVVEFAVGMLSWCSSILRISFWKYAADVDRDPTYNAPLLYILCIAEVSIAIGCVSVAALRPLVVKVTKGFNRLRGKPVSTNKSRFTNYNIRASPSLAKSKGYGSSTSGSKKTSNKDGFEEHMIADQELMEWEDNVLGTKRSQQQACSCTCRDGDIELGGIAAHTSSCASCPDLSQDTKPETPTLAPAATDHGTIHHSPRCSSGETLSTTSITSACQGAHSWPPCDAIISSESTVNLTNADSNSKTTVYPDP